MSFRSILCVTDVCARVTDVWAHVSEAHTVRPACAHISGPTSVRPARVTNVRAPVSEDAEARLEQEPRAGAGLLLKSVRMGAKAMCCRPCTLSVDSVHCLYTVCR
jgi:hypothetical protein